MYQISKIITESAKLKIPPKSGASLEKRAMMADDLMDSFCKEIAPDFQKKGFITKSKLEEVFAKLLPDINLKISQSPEVPGYKWNASIVEKIVREPEKNKIVGFEMKLPFTQNCGEEILTVAESLLHETTHLFTNITNPKFEVKGILSSKTVEYAKGYWRFLESFLYPAKPLREAKVPNKEVIDWLGDGFTKLFGTTEGNSYDKIEIFQNFRHKLKHEQIAYPQGHIRANQLLNPKIQNDCKETLKHAAKEKFEDKYAFQDKINLLETLLKAELRKVREQHKNASVKICN